MTIYQNGSPLYPVTKYLKWHDAIIDRALSQNRKKSKNGTYYENHHVVPGALGGPDEKGNRVLLTAKEHFIVHLCLSKMFEGFCTFGDRKMKHAIKAMTWKAKTNHGRRLTSAQYDMAKRIHAKAASENMKGRIFSPESRRKMSEAKQDFIPWNKGLVGMEPWNKGLTAVQTAWNKGIKGGKSYERTERHAEITKQIHIGRKRSDETKAKIKASWVKRRSALQDS